MTYRLYATFDCRGWMRRTFESLGDNTTGLGAIDAERFDIASAVGGWCGVMESAVATLFRLTIDRKSVV